jgi:hypothetical protein
MGSKNDIARKKKKEASKKMDILEQEHARIKLSHQDAFIKEFDKIVILLQNNNIDSVKKLYEFAQEPQNNFIKVPLLELCMLYGGGKDKSSADYQYSIKAIDNLINMSFDRTKDVTDKKLKWYYKFIFSAYIDIKLTIECNYYDTLESSKAKKSYFQKSVKNFIGNYEVKKFSKICFISDAMDFAKIAYIKYEDKELSTISTAKNKYILEPREYAASHIFDFSWHRYKTALYKKGSGSVNLFSLDFDRQEQSFFSCLSPEEKIGVYIPEVSITGNDQTLYY